jgi:hypothetical protein
MDWGLGDIAGFRTTHNANGLNPETAVELISRKDAKTQSKRGRMVVDLSQVERLFTQ